MKGFASTVFVLFMFLDEGFTAIPSPVNLNIQCHNFSVRAYWNYSQPSLQPSFTVELFRYGGERINVTNCWNIRRRHCDVSRLVLHSVKESYFVRVSAVVGSEQSAPAVSPEFTYNRNMVEEEHCLLDFPRVNMSVWRGELSLVFTHPWEVYREALRHEKTQKCKAFRKFSYSVHSRGQGKDSLRLDCEYRCKEHGSVCEGRLLVSETLEKHCVTLEGVMNDIQVVTAEEICVGRLPPAARTGTPSRDAGSLDSSLAISLLVAVVVLVLLALIAVLAFRRKTRGTSAIPKMMASLLTGPHSAGRLLQPEPDVASEVQCMHPPADPAPDPPQDCSAADTLAPIPPEGSRFPLGVEAEPARRGGAQDVDSPPVEFSGYDRPQVLSVEIGPGDNVQGYESTQA